jgi:hypothetical protein
MVKKQVPRIHIQTNRVSKKLKVLDKIIDDFALGKYDTQQEAIADLIA